MKQNKNEDSESSSGFGTIIVYILVIYIGLTYIDKKVTRIGFVNKINTELFGSNKNNLNNSSNENNTESSYTNSSESSSEMGSEIPNKFIGRWKCYDGTKKIIIIISYQEKLPEPTENQEYILFDIKVLQGINYLFIYNKERDVLRQYGGHMVSDTVGEIMIDENSGNLLFENLEWTKVD